MTDEMKREVLKAYHYDYELELIASVFNITEDEVNKIVDENGPILKQLEARVYGN